VSRITWLISFRLASNFTAARLGARRIEKIEEIEARGRRVLLVGGTGFYLRALRQPFFPSPPTDERLRARLSKIRETSWPERLHRILQHFDLAEADNLNPVIGRACSARSSSACKPANPFHVSGPCVRSRRPSPREFASCADPPRRELYGRINERTEKHFANGLVDEVRRLLDEGVPAESNALGAHGYRRVVEHLRGQRELRSAIEQTKLDVRHYAKRQLTWFRHESGVDGWTASVMMLASRQQLFAHFG